jgi:SAM-dependent methyltransferase
MTTTDNMRVFDRALVARRRARAWPQLAEHDFLFRDVADRLADRLNDTTRRYPDALLLGRRGAALEYALAGTGRVDRTVVTELDPVARPDVVADEEMLPFAAGSFDLVTSNLSLHWVNDLPGTLLQARTILRPDGLFLAAMLGGQTLHELRTCLVEAEAEISGGIAPRISPFADVRDAAGLLQRAGFQLPVADRDQIRIAYEHPMRLLADLRGMGETHAGIARGRPLSRPLLALAMRLYAERFADRNGRCIATFEVLYLAGWAPPAPATRPRPETQT